MKTKIFTILFVCLLVFTGKIVLAQTIEFSTILPSPIGSYDRIRLMPQGSVPVGVCNTGEVYYDSGLQTLQICKTPGVWGGVGSVWQESSTASFEYIRMRKNQPASIGDTTSQVIGWHVVVNRTADQAYEDAHRIVVDLDVIADETTPAKVGTFIANDAKVSRVQNPFGFARMDGSNQIFMVDGQDSALGTFIPLEIEGDPILFHSRDTPGVSLSKPPTNIRRVGVGVNTPEQMLHVREIMQGVELVARKNGLNPYGYMKGGDTPSGASAEMGVYYWISAVNNGFGRMKIDGNPLTFQVASGGRVGIGVTNPTETLTMKDKALAESLSIHNLANDLTLGIRPNTALSLIDIEANDTSVGGYGDARLEIDASTIIMQVASGGGVGVNSVANPLYRLTVSGTVRSTVFTPALPPLVVSDENLKTDIVSIDNSLDEIMKLQGVYFQWKDPAKPAGEYLGVIAQNVEEVFPEAVITDQEGYKAVTYEVLVAPLIDAVNTLKEKNDVLRERIRLLEEKRVLGKTQ